MSKPVSREIPVVLIAVALSLAIGFFIFGHRASSGAASEPSLYEKIKERGQIRAGYAVGAPYFVKDPNTNEVSGIFADVMQEVGKGLGLEIQWVEEVGYGQMIEALRSKRVDLIGSGVWINANRATGADFSTPVLYDAVSAFARADDKRFDQNLGLANSPTVKISTIDGEMAASIAAADFPMAKTEALPQTSEFTQMILNVVDKKADLTFLALGPARKFQAENPNSIRNITPRKPVRVFPTAIVLPQGEHELRRAIDLALLQLVNDGTIDRIISRYEEEPGSHLRLAPSFLPSSE